MPHASFKIKPGVDQNETPALNEAGLSTSNLIRFIYDRNGNGLVQKLGGWTKYYSNSFSKVIRAIWPWEDANSVAHLAVGTQNGDDDNQAQLSVITNGALKTVTPQTVITNSSTSLAGISFVSTTAGSSIVNITDKNVAGINQYDCVYIATQISVGGLILFGLYECITVSGNTYSIQAVDVLGTPIAATSTATSGVLPYFTTLVGSNSVAVTLPSHGYNVGSTFTILLPITIGGLYLYGDYLVQTVSSASTPSNSFTITATTNATSSSSSYINGNLANYTYNFGIGATQTGSGYGAGLYGKGGYGVGTVTSPTTLGNPISAYNWSFDNWGSYLVSVPLTSNAPFKVFSALASGDVGIFLDVSVYKWTTYFAAEPYNLYPDDGTGLFVGQVVSGLGGSIQQGTRITNIETTTDPDYPIKLTINLPVIGLTSDQYTEVLYSDPEGSQYRVPVGRRVTLSGFSPSEWNQSAIVTVSAPGVFRFLPSPSLSGSPTTLGVVAVEAAPYQPVYIYDPLGTTPISVAIPNAPVYNDGVFVAMPQRQLVTWGTTFTGIPDPLLIRWSDVNNFDSWIGTVVNQAGSYRLPKGSRIVAAIQAPQQGLIFTDLGVWAMQYTGPPYVYGFNELATGCGLIARKAVASIAGAVYWMGNSQFFTLSGSGVQPVPCPIWDVIFQDLDTSNLDKIRVAVNSLFGEITWYYPSLSNGGEINAYVKYNVYLQCWDFGTLSRSAWTDQSVLGKPIGADPITGYLYQHETSNSADGQAMNSFFRTGYFAMSEADIKSFVDEVWPDMKWGFYGGDQSAIVNITFYVTDFAGQPPEVYGPYPMTQSTTWFNPRFRGRLVSIQLSTSETNINSFWRLGNIRYRVQPDGRY